MLRWSGESQVNVRWTSGERQVNVRWMSNLILSLTLVDVKFVLFSEDVMERSSERKVMVLREAADSSRPEICNAQLFYFDSIGTFQWGECCWQALPSFWHQSDSRKQRRQGDMSQVNTLQLSTKLLIIYPNIVIQMRGKSVPCWKDDVQIALLS